MGGRLSIGRSGLAPHAKKVERGFQRAAVMGRGFFDQPIEFQPERLFLIAFAVIPGAALECHDQHVIPDEMRRQASFEPFAVGFIGP